MLFQHTLTSLLLIAGQTAASKIDFDSAVEAIGNIQRRSVELDAALQDNAINFLTHLNGRSPVDKRAPQSSTGGSAPNPSVSPLSGDSGASSANSAAWEAKTAKACTNAISQLVGGASNPSGMAVCYNLPFLDNSTGVFEAELRMYNVSAPVDPWVGISAADINLSMSYLGATVSLMKKRDVEPLVPRQSKLGQQLKLLQFVGQINSNLIGQPMTEDKLQNLLIPIITLSTVAISGTQSGSQINTTLSSTEASFVSGVFEDKASNRTTAATLASASAAILTATPFVVPGRTLGVYPTGLIIVMIWTGLFCIAVGWGTFERIKFREQYRRRTQMDNGKGIRTI